MSASWVAALAALEQAGEAAMLVTVTEAKGSAPREAGTKMVVTASTIFGTIGGGRLEHDCIAQARRLLATDGPLIERHFPLGPALGQCCGGAVCVLFERVVPPTWHVALFGAGHVGKALASLLAPLPCRLHWFDTRPEALDGLPTESRPTLTADAPAEIDALPAGTFVLVMTHDHALDFRIAERALARADLGAVGMIGSHTKRARFASGLRKHGLDPARLVCPIGVPGAGGKLPAEIAISVAAQLLQWRDAKPAAPQPALPEQACDPACGDCAVKVRA